MGLHPLQEEVISSDFATAMRLTNEKSSSQRSNLSFALVAIFGLLGLGLTLGCSVGALLVQVTTPTPTPFKTPQPTFTFTPNWTPTFTPSPIPTDTPTPTPTPTQTPTPTPTSEESAAPAQAAVEAAPPAPAEPTATPPPPEPEATPTSVFPFSGARWVHDTGSPGETRITAWIRLDIAPGQYKTLSNFQIKAIAPDGKTYLSDPSGSGTADSTPAGAGDSHKMNTKLEIRPYTPGLYKIQLVEGGVQVSPEYEITLTTDPRQYVHFEFSKQQ